MGRSETFEHTADLGLRVFAADLPDLFRTAGYGLFDVIVANREDVQSSPPRCFLCPRKPPRRCFSKWLNERQDISPARPDTTCTPASKSP